MEKTELADNSSRNIKELRLGRRVAHFSKGTLIWLVLNCSACRKLSITAPSPDKTTTVYLSETADDCCGSYTLVQFYCFP